MGRPQLTATLVVGLALAVFTPTIARAQSAQDKAAAESAFEEGKRLMTAHAYAEACPKFAESLRLDPGLGTMLGLADCFEKNGQTASAWGEFREAAGVAARKQDKREALARENAARLEPLLSKLVVHVSLEADVRGLAVKRDGIDVERAAWGEAVPVDPGVHALAASAPGRKDWQTTINVSTRASVQTVTIPRLEDAPPPPAARVADATQGSPPVAPDASTTNDGRTQRTAAVAVGGAGVVAVVVGTVFGLHAKSKLDDSNANGHCDASNACDGPGLTLRSDAKSAATVSTVAFVIGGAAIAGGAVLWFTAPHGDRAAVGVAPSLHGVTLTGVF